MSKLENIVSIADIAARKGVPFRQQQHELTDYFPPKSITPYTGINEQDKEFMRAYPQTHIATISSVRYKLGKHYYKLLLPEDPGSMAGTFYYDRTKKQFYIDVEQLVSDLIRDTEDVPFNERYIIARTRTGKDHYKLVIYRRNAKVQPPLSK